MGTTARRALSLLGSAALAACGDNVGTALPDVPPDAAAFPIGEATYDVDAAMPTAPAEMPDAPAEQPAVTARCDPSKPFATPVPLAALNTSDRDIQAMSPDGVAVYFATNRDGTLDLYTATRTADGFTKPAALAGFASSTTETSPYVSSDGLTLVYAGAPSGVTFGDLYISTRASTTAGWSVGTLLTGPSSTSYDDGDPVVTGDGGVLYFASQRGTSYDLYMSVRGSDGKFGAAQPVTELNTADYDAHPRVTADGLTMYWSSMRNGDGAATGGADIWKATRVSRAGAFGAAVRVPELDTTANESPTWISDDGCVIYLQSNRTGGAGDQDIWVATKPL